MNKKKKKWKKFFVYENDFFQISDNIPIIDKTDPNFEDKFNIFYEEHKKEIPNISKDFLIVCSEVKYRCLLNQLLDVYSRNKNCLDNENLMLNSLITEEHFYTRIWELYIVYIFVKNGCKIKTFNEKEKLGGPEFFITINGTDYYIEATSVNICTKFHPVEEYKFDKEKIEIEELEEGFVCTKTSISKDLQTFLNQKISKIIDGKIKKLKKWKKDKRFNPQSKFVLCLNVCLCFQWNEFTSFGDDLCRFFREKKDDYLKKAQGFDFFICCTGDLFFNLECIKNKYTSKSLYLYSNLGKKSVFFANMEAGEILKFLLNQENRLKDI